VDGLTKVDKVKKIHHQRTCFLCRHKHDAAAMLRLVVDSDGEIWPDVLHKAPGRGSYLCMETGCLARLNDRSIARLKRHFPILKTNKTLLFQRFNAAFLLQAERSLGRLLITAALGRDAVMHRMWHHAPLLVMVTDQSGSSLQRQMVDAVEKRRNDGKKVELWLDFDADMLAKVSRREKISVVAARYCKDAVRLQQFSTWLDQVKEAG
jgi:predicted RNA-binding protein YlxR (DUF448 family)